MVFWGFEAGLDILVNESGFVMHLWAVDIDSYDLRQAQ
jgi:hypothetical protein